MNVDIHATGFVIKRKKDPPIEIEFEEEATYSDSGSSYVSVSMYVETAKYLLRQLSEVLEDK